MSRDDSTATADETRAGDAQTSPSSTAEPTTVESSTAEATATESANTESATTESTGAQTASAGDDEQKPKRTKAKSTSARKTRTVELTLTVTGTADGEWQAELKQGSKWVARGLEIPAAAVSRAAKELHDELSVPIDEVINAAREQQQAKVAQLEAELEEAKKTLAHLDED